MSGPVFHVGASAMCPHGGTVTTISDNTRVLASGQPVATMADSYVVAGCPFQVPTSAGPVPQPCATVQWLAPAARVAVNGQPVITQASTGLCFSVEQVPQGPPTVVTTQPRVMAT